MSDASLTAEQERELFGPDDPTPVAAALARVRAEVGMPDDCPDEHVTLRVGDVWTLLAELERRRRPGEDR